MAYFRTVVVIVGILFCSPVISVCAENHTVRIYTNKTLTKKFITNITLKGYLLHTAKFKFWLNQIAKIPVGEQTLIAIIESGHQLTIAHNKHARISSGRTQAPLTDNLINGKGESVTILFDGSINEFGSHMVFNPRKKLIAYTAIYNLFHELVHAKHKMNGTWLYFDSEKQAIEEENQFRKEWSIFQGEPISERFGSKAVPIETVRVDFQCSESYHIRSNPPKTITPPCS